MVKIKSLLQSKSFYYLLIGVNIIIGLAVFKMSISVEFPDGNGYWQMAKSIGEGKFSSWYFLDVNTPETLRTWGYPFIIYLCQLLHDSPLTVKLLQLFMHAGAIWLCLQLLIRFNNTLIYRNIFLLLLIPNIQIVYYTGQIAAETTNIFFLVLYMYIWMVKSDNWYKVIVLAIIAFIIYQLRPVFLLAPFAMAGYHMLRNRSQLRYNVVFVILFSILLLPFGLWNKKVHGVFKVTPLEGGAGAAHIGFWSFRLPDGYNPKFYWDSHISKDIIQPEFVSAAKKEMFRSEYEKEWNTINKELENYLTHEDSVRMEIYKRSEYNLLTQMSGNYTQAREKLLTSYLKKDIADNPGYYLKTRIYTMMRLWFTGINEEQFSKSGGTGKLKLIYPFVVTFIFIFCGLLFVLYSFIRNYISYKKYWPFLLIILYYGLLHVPFAIQARYTVPVHLFILLLLAIVVGNKISKPVNVKTA
jgi:hypothetical protein